MPVSKEQVVEDLQRAFMGIRKDEGAHIAGWPKANHEAARAVVEAFPEILAGMPFDERLKRAEEVTRFGLKVRNKFMADNYGHNPYRRLYGQ